MKDKNPIVEIRGIDVEDNAYEYNGKLWRAKTLIDATQGLPVYDLQISAIDLHVSTFNVSSFYSFLVHLKRISEVNPDYPIIQTPEGFICDGWHRLAKAILDSRATIKAVRLRKMPPHDEEVSE